MVSFSRETPFGEVLDHVEHLLTIKGGGKCPACTQDVKRRREVLYASIVHCLAIVYRFGGLDEPIGLPVIRAEQSRITGAKVQQKNDWTKNINRLRFWNLAYPIDGQYLCAPAGEMFLLGRHKVPKIAWTFNSQVLEYGGSLIGVDEVRNIKFDLKKFLNDEL